MNPLFELTPVSLFVCVLMLLFVFPVSIFMCVKMGTAAYLITRSRFEKDVKNESRET